MPQVIVMKQVVIRPLVVVDVALQAIAFDFKLLRGLTSLTRSCTFHNRLKKSDNNNFEFRSRRLLHHSFPSPLLQKQSANWGSKKKKIQRIQKLRNLIKDLRMDPEIEAKLAPLRQSVKEQVSRIYKL